MKVIEWYWYRLLSKLLAYPRVSYTPANPFQVFETMRSDGRDHWGRRVVFVDWLTGTFGEEAGRTIWLHIREPSPTESGNDEKILESPV